MSRELFGSCPLGEPADALQVEKTRLLYATLPTALVANILLALVLISVQHAVVSSFALFAWFAIFVTVLSGRGALGFFWHRYGMVAENCACWLRRFRIAAIATGATWGMAALLLFPIGDINHQSYLAFVLAGLSAGVISSLAIDRIASLGFLVPMLLPLIARFMLEGGKQAWSMGLMVALFLGLMAMNASRNRRGLQENIRLRLKAEDQGQMLRLSEDRLNQAQRTAHLGNWELDVVNNQLYWSDEVYRIFEIDQAFFAPSYEAFLNALHPDDRDRVNQAYTLSLETREPYEITHRLLTSDGRIKWVTERCDSLFDTEGKPLRSVGTVQDITDKKLAEAELEWQIRNQQALLNAIQESTFLMERNGTMLVVNGVGAQRLNTTPEELVGKNIYEMLPPEVAESRRVRFEQVARSGKAEIMEDERAGRRFLSSIYPVLDINGGVNRFAVYAADVTQQRRVEAIEALFSAINLKVLQGLPLPELLHFICNEVAHLFDLDLIWLGRKEIDGSVSIVTQAGAATGYVEGVRRLGVRWDDTPQGRGGTGTAIRSGRIQAINPSNPGFKVWRDLAREYDFRSMLAIPLLIRSEVYGAFTLYSSKLDTFSAAVTELLVGISTRISVAFEAAMDQQQIRLLSSALAGAGNGVMITNPRGIIQWVNPAFVRLCGYSKEELVGQTPRLLKSGQQSPEYYQLLWETISRGEMWSSETVERSKDGTIYTVSQTITPMLDEDDKVTHFIAIHEDITTQKQTQERIQYMAHYDALTDLPNRVLFYDRLRQALSMAKRNHGGLALLFMDLDGFKKVNDTMGHHAGDLLLNEVAERLRQCVRESDTVARLGGDEFTVILNEAHEHHSVARVAEKIIESIALPFDLEGSEARVGISIGIARYSEEANGEDELVKQADEAMYEAKDAGKNTYRFASAR